MVFCRGANEPMDGAGKGTTGTVVENANRKAHNVFSGLINGPWFSFSLLAFLGEETFSTDTALTESQR